MWLKILLVAMLLFIIFNLFNALFHLMKGSNQDTRVVKSLTWRVGLSIGLFILLMIGFFTGIIGVRPAPF